MSLLVDPTSPAPRRPPPQSPPQSPRRRPTTCSAASSPASAPTGAGPGSGSCRSSAATAIAEDGTAADVAAHVLTEYAREARLMAGELGLVLAGPREDLDLRLVARSGAR